MDAEKAGRTRSEWVFPNPADRTRHVYEVQKLAQRVRRNSKVSYTRLQLWKMWAASWTMKSAKRSVREKYLIETKQVVSSLNPSSWIASSLRHGAPMLVRYRLAKSQAVLKKLTFSSTLAMFSGVRDATDFREHQPRHRAPPAGKAHGSWAGPWPLSTP